MIGGPQELELLLRHTYATTAPVHATTLLPVLPTHPANIGAITPAIVYSTS